MHSPLLGLELGRGVPWDEEESSHRVHVTQSYMQRRWRHGYYGFMKPTHKMTKHMCEKIWQNYN